jgi:hypothetical protein
VISQYNTQVAKLTPPRPPLSWKEIVDYSFLGEFDVLWYSRNNVNNQPWAQVLHRKATVKYFKLCHACEEVIRLDIKIRCLRTFIHDETILTPNVISMLSTSNPPLATELQQRWYLHNAVNHLHIQHLDAIEKSHKLTGLCGVGRHLSPPDTMQMLTMGDAERLEDNDDEVVVDDDDEVVEDGNHDLENVTDFILALVD